LSRKIKFGSVSYDLLLIQPLQHRLKFNWSNQGVIWKCKPIIKRKIGIGQLPVK